MKLHTKIRQLRQERKIKLTQLHSRIKHLFGEQTLAYRSLQRIEAGQTDAKISSLHQICLGLGITMKTLYEDVEDAQTDLIRRGNPHGKYIYSNAALAEILSTNTVNFFALHLILEPGGKTKVEKDPEGNQKFTKWIYVLSGKLACFLEKEKIILKKGDAFCFDSRVAHYFENKHSNTTQCIIIHNPRRI